jgi:hypothetical protein
MSSLQWGRIFAGLIASLTRLLFAAKAILVVATAAYVLMACEAFRAPQNEVDGFLKKHWRDPIPAQGVPPKTWSSLEADLRPEACASCHPDQFRDWQGSLHSRTMGPGIYWQFEKIGPDESNRCLRCHAPLAEQKALLAGQMAWPNAPKTSPPSYVGTDLHKDGLMCAACHVRAHTRFGPPARGGDSRGAPSAHAGFVATTAFEDSRFCATCHQFPEDGPRLSGKLREDTYAQWSASSFAPSQSCQSCHMEERRHLWRGVHDPDMFRRAAETSLTMERVDDSQYRVIVVVRNIGAGHHLPTYMVAKINLVLFLSIGSEPPREIGRDVIGWRTDVFMNDEEFDTRIPAGASHRFVKVFRIPPGGRDWKVRLDVNVDPAEHYIRTFRYSLGNVDLSQSSQEILRRAIAEAEAKRYTAMSLSAKP